MPKYQFEECNSGGSWWLSRADYEKLFTAGFQYEASDYDIKNGHDTKPLCGGDDKVPYGWRHNCWIEAETIRQAIEIWEAATGKDFFAAGCACCGPPFTMHTEDYSESESGGYEARSRPW